MPDHTDNNIMPNRDAAPDTDTEMLSEITKFKLHQENESLKQEIDRLRASQGRSAKYDESTSFQLKTQALTDTIHHNFCVTRIEALLLQTRIALFTFNNAAATAAITRINTLLRSGSTLAIPVSSVLRGRCTFWYGMFFHNIKDYDSALECFVLASDLLSTVKQPETGTPCTPHGPLPEGAYEAERVLKMKLKAELEISRTPATTTTTTSTVLATPAKDRQPSLDILRQESVVPLSARLWRQTSHSSWADELSSLCDEGSSSSSSSDGEDGDDKRDDECSDTSSSVLHPVHEGHQLKSELSGRLGTYLAFRNERPGSSASMTSTSSAEHSIAKRRHVQKPVSLTLSSWKEQW